MSQVPEFHRPLPVSQLGGVKVAHEVVASAAECAALAVRLGIPALASLACRFTLRARPGGVVVAEGELRASLTRDCVVSLEPFETSHAERFSIRFVPAALDDSEPSPDPESDDEIPYAEGVIDLGEAASEQLALALDPYPRSPGAQLPDSAAAEPTSPFAALARLPRRN